MPSLSLCTAHSPGLQLLFTLCLSSHPDLKKKALSSDAFPLSSLWSLISCNERTRELCVPFALTKGKDCSIPQASTGGVTASAQRDASPVGAVLPNATAPSCSYFLLGCYFYCITLLQVTGPSTLPLPKEPSICWAAVSTSGKEGRSPWAEAALGQHSLNVVLSVACYIHSPSSLGGRLFLTSTTRATNLLHEVQSHVQRHLRRVCEPLQGMRKAKGQFGTADAMAGSGRDPTSPPKLTTSTDSLQLMQKTSPNNLGARETLKPLGSTRGSAWQGRARKQA